RCHQRRGCSSALGCRARATTSSPRDGRAAAAGRWRISFAANLGGHDRCRA
ncbi:Os05g0553300, partial [Oryza sativa Japonica Group]